MSKKAMADVRTTWGDDGPLDGEICRDKKQNHPNLSGNGWRYFLMAQNGYVMSIVL